MDFCKIGGRGWKGLESGRSPALCKEEASGPRAVLEVLVDPPCPTLNHFDLHFPPLHIVDNTIKNMSFENVTPLGPKSTVELAPIADAKHRAVDRVVVPMDTSDGAGVSLRRSIGSPKLPNLDPFLMLDEFKSDDVRFKFWHRFFTALCPLHSLWIGASPHS